MKRNKDFNAVAAGAICGVAPIVGAVILAVARRGIEHLPDILASIWMFITIIPAAAIILVLVLGTDLIVKGDTVLPPTRDR